MNHRMQRRNFLIKTGQTALGFSIFPGCSHRNTSIVKAVNPHSHKSRIVELEKQIPRLMEESVVPGLSIALVQDGKLVWRQGFGVKDSLSNEPVDHDTVFEAASVSKTVFAYAVLKLCEKSILDLDAPLTKYAPKPFLSGDPRLELITARHVLSHTTGFQDWRSGNEPLKIHFRPGEKFMYSGEGYFYMQSIVTHLTEQVDSKNCAQYEAGLEVCGTDIDAFLKRTLLVPMGMDSSGYLWNDRFEKQAAHPHGVDGKPGKKGMPSTPDAARYASAGGLHTTATDYAKFLIEIVDPKSSGTYRLTKKSLNEMIRPQAKLPTDQKIDGAGAWGLGWAIQERKTGNVIVHSGGQSGFRSLAMASVERKSGFIILTNGDNGGKVIYKLADALNWLFVG